MKYLVLLILLVPSLVNAEYRFAENWTWKDTAAQAGFLSLLAIDLGQTLYISSHPDEYSEMNVILGSHPSEDKVWAYFISCAIAHTMIALSLPPKPRLAWQGTWIGIEGLCIGRNFGLGIGVEY